MRSINKTEHKCEDYEKHRQRRMSKGGTIPCIIAPTPPPQTKLGGPHLHPTPHNPQLPFFLGLHHHFTLFVRLICKQDEPKYEGKSKIQDRNPPNNERVCYSKMWYKIVDEMILK